MLRLTSLFALSAAAQGLNARFLGYIDRYKEVAMEHCRSHGVPASITLAQGLLESNAGQSSSREERNRSKVSCLFCDVNFILLGF